MSLSATRRSADGQKRCWDAPIAMLRLSPSPTSLPESPGRCCADNRGSPHNRPWRRRIRAFGHIRRPNAKRCLREVTTRWPDSRTALRKPDKSDGLQGRSIYEDRNARISILAGRASSSRPDTLKQTDQPRSRQTPCRRGGPYVGFAWLGLAGLGFAWAGLTLGETALKQWSTRALCVATAIALLASGAQARITRIEIIKSEPAFGGASFDEAGAYVHLVGRVSGEVDPADPANALIQDISLAPRNARGLVEYTTHIELLKPAELAR